MPYAGLLEKKYSLQAATITELESPGIFIRVVSSRDNFKQSMAGSFQV